MADADFKNLTGVIDRMEGERAVIRLDDGQEIVWPKEKLSEGLGEGSSVKLIVLSDKDLENNRQEVAKNILKEIFKSDE
jgi:hypothetical protein